MARRKKVGGAIPWLILRLNRKQLVGFLEGMESLKRTVEELRVELAALQAEQKAKRSAAARKANETRKASAGTVNGQPYPAAELAPLEGGEQ